MNFQSIPTFPGFNVDTLAFTMPSLNPERGAWNPIHTAIAASKPVYTDEEFAVGVNNVNVYDNSSSGKVTITRLTGQTGIPNSTGCCLKISYDGTGTYNVNPQPAYGGFCQVINSAANKTFVQRFVAKVPAGRSLTLYENATGTNRTSYWLTSNLGTDKWEQYIRVVHCGNTGTFSNSGHVAVWGGSNTAFDWYLASCNAYEVNTPIYSVVQPLDAGLTSIAGLTGSGYIKATGTDVFSMVSSIPWSDISGAPSSYTPAAHALSSHSDTSISTPSSGQFLKYNGTYWVNSAHGLTYSDVGASASGHNHSGVYEPVISGGTSAQYWRGDKTWQTLSTANVTESGNLYYTDTRARAAILNTVTGLTYTSGTGVLSMTSGYVIPTTTEQSSWTAKEPGLGNPSVSGYLLSSTTGGARSWVAPYSHPSTHSYAIIDSVPTATLLGRNSSGTGAAEALSASTARTLLGLTGWATKAYTNGSTTDVAEGSNLYYTDARARAAILENITGIDYSSSTGLLSLTSGYFIPTTTEQSTWNSKQAGDSTLTALAALTGAGYIKASATDTFSMVSSIPVADVDTSSLVHLAGTETITGAKTFSNTLTSNTWSDGVWFGRTTVSLPYPNPGGGAGSGMWYIRLRASTPATLLTVRVTVSGTWSYAAVMGHLTGEYTIYTYDGVITTSDFRVTRTSGEAYLNLRLGAPVIENGYISIPVYCLNSNSIYANVEWSGYTCTPTATAWVSAAMPAANFQSIQGALSVGNLNSVALGTLQVGNASACSIAAVCSNDTNYRATLKVNYDSTKALQLLGVQDVELLRHISGSPHVLALMPTSGNVTINGYTAWHAGNHGSGSAMDADKLDGQHGSYYLDTSATGQTKAGSLAASSFSGAGTGLTGTAASLSIGGNAATVTGLSISGGAADLNTLVTAGFYRVGASNANDPSSSKYGQMLIMRAYGDTITQIYGDYATGSLYTRGGSPTQVGGVGSWSSWKEILDSGNYNSYSPTLSGTGASGNWGINVTGSSASCTGNAATATVGSSSKKLGLWDGTTFTAGTNQISTYGSRTSDLLPSQYDRNLVFEFKNSYLYSSTGNYSGLLTIAPWTGTTAGGGDGQYQLLFSPASANSTNPPTVKIRTGIDSTWGSWSTILHSSNYTSYIIRRITDETTALRMVNPPGAAYNPASSTVTGAIKITLPTTASTAYSMLRMTVKVYSYEGDTAAPGRTFEIGGYIYGPNHTWHNVFAYQMGAGGGGPLNVRFGWDGSSYCVWIGELATVWQYPHVEVTEVQSGYTGITDAILGGTWSISAVTSFDTIGHGPLSAHAPLNTTNYSSYAIPITGASDGTASAPSFTFAADTDTGMYRAATNTIGFAVGGSQAMSISSAGASVVGGIVLSNASSAAVFQINGNGTNTGKIDIMNAGNTASMVRIDSAGFSWINGYLAVGSASTASYKLDVTGDFRCTTSAYVNAGLTVGTTATVAGYNVLTEAKFVSDPTRTGDNNYNLAGRTQGIYAINGLGTNGPGSSYLNLIHCANSIDVAFQIAGGYQSDNMYFRGCTNLAGGTGWGAWRTVLHSGNFSTYAEVANHKYHQFSDGQYFYDSYEQKRYFRLWSNNSMGDVWRFCAPTNVEYWTGSAWAEWVGGDAIIKTMLDGNESTVSSIDHTHRKFRFQLTRSTGWPLGCLVVLDTNWSGITFTGLSVTEEHYNTSAWVTKYTALFSGGTTYSGWGTHAYYTENVHDSYTAIRITVDITDWTDNGSYTTFPIRGLHSFSNYGTGSGQMQPWSWDWAKLVTFNGGVTTTGALTVSAGGATINGATAINGGNLTVANTYRIIHSDGVATAPSFTYSSDTDTGLFNNGADQLGVTTGGTVRAIFSNNGLAATKVLAGSTSSSGEHTMDVQGSLGWKVSSHTDGNTLGENLVAICNPTSADMTLNLPDVTAAYVDRTYVVHNKGSYIVNVHPYSGDYINGATSDFKVYPGGSIMMVCEAYSSSVGYWRTLVFQTTDSVGGTVTIPAIKVIKPTSTSPYSYTIPLKENGYTYLCKALYGSTPTTITLTLPSPHGIAGFKVCVKAITNPAQTSAMTDIMILSQGTGYADDGGSGSAGRNILNQFSTGSNTFIGNSTTDAGTFDQQCWTIRAYNAGTWPSYVEFVSTGDMWVATNNSYLG